MGNWAEPVVVVSECTQCARGEARERTECHRRTGQSWCIANDLMFPSFHSASTQACCWPKIKPLLTPDQVSKLKDAMQKMASGAMKAHAGATRI